MIIIKKRQALATLFSQHSI